MRGYWSPSPPEWEDSDSELPDGFVDSEQAPSPDDAPISGELVTAHDPNGLIGGVLADSHDHGDGPPQDRDAAPASPAHDADWAMTPEDSPQDEVGPPQPGPMPATPAPPCGSPCGVQPAECDHGAPLDGAAAWEPPHARVGPAGLWRPNAAAEAPRAQLEGSTLHEFAALAAAEFARCPLETSQVECRFAGLRRRLRADGGTRIGEGKQMPKEAWGIDSSASEGEGEAPPEAEAPPLKRARAGGGGEVPVPGPSEDDGAQAAGDVPGMERPGVQPGPTVAPAGLPEGLPEIRSGMEWWVRPLWEVARGPRSKLPARPRRAFRYESICSGTLGELFGFQAIRGHRIHRSRPSRPARERAPLP